MAGGLLLLGAAGWSWQSARAEQEGLAQALAASPVAATDLEGSLPIRVSRKDSFQQGEALFRLRIPRIGVNNIVVWGSTEAALAKGPGLVEGTPLPGEGGNAVIAGHRDYYFWALGELEPGDRVLIERGAQSLTYVVQERRVVPETATEILAGESEQVTIFTCWPLIYAGRSPERLVVTAVPLADWEGEVR